jgi:hypothetical protein
MTAAVNLKEGKRNAFVCSLAVIVIFLQAYLAILFAQVIDIRPDILSYCVKWDLVYLSADVYFF